MQFTDAVAIGSEPRMTRDGYMVCDARIARSGCQTYRGVELGRPELDTVTVYRPPENVFDRKAMGSFANRPVTIEHPSSLVTADTWKSVAVGMTGDTVAKDGEYIRVPFLLMDSGAIQAIKSGKRELSCGYTSEIIWQDGETEDGQKYQAVMSAITGNHLAVVDKARAGPACKIGDNWTDPPPLHFPSTTSEPRIVMADVQMRTVLHDGLEIQTTTQGAQAIEALQRRIADSASALESKEGQIKA